MMDLKSAFSLVIGSMCLTVASHLYAKNIVIIDSYHRGYDWAESERKGFEDHINPDYQITYFEMDTKRANQDKFSIRAEIIWKEASARDPDIFVTMDDNALKYLGHRIIDAGFPLVFMGVENDPRAYFAGNVIPENVAGVLEKPLLKQNISLITQLIPTNNQRILFMMDNSISSRSTYSRFLGSQKSTSFENIELETYLAVSYDDWKKKIVSISPLEYDALIITGFAALKDHKGEQVSTELIANWTSQTSPVPLFSYWKGAVGQGKAIGGLAVSGYEHGYNSSKVVNFFLSTGRMPNVEVLQRGEPYFSEVELTRWGIELPKFIRKRSVIIK